MTSQTHPRHAGRRHQHWVLAGMLLGAALLFVFPLIWMVATTLKPETQAASASLSLLPDPPSTAPAQAARNYADVWNDPSIEFPLYLRNTLIVALLSVVGMTLSSAAVAYGLSRITWRGRGAVFVTVLITMMIPFPVLMVPLYMVFRWLGWIDTLRPLWVPAWFGGAFNIFLLRQFFLGIPKELSEAARVDGAGHWTTFWRVIVPLSRPALALVALFHFIYVWNDFLAPLVFITKPDQRTLALGLQLYQSKAGLTPWNLLMAASTMVVAPVLLLFLLTQRAFVRGIAAEGLKE
ncbi:MAG: carbohydrate ABC transporter permease [Phycisphaerales bacterium]